MIARDVPDSRASVDQRPDRIGSRRADVLPGSRSLNASAGVIESLVFTGRPVASVHVYDTRLNSYDGGRKSETDCPRQRQSLPSYVTP